MKKIVGILLLFTLIITFIPGAQAAGDPEIISVTAPQIDNTIYEYGERVRVQCKNTEFTKMGVDVDIMHTAKESIYNLEIINDTTIEFDLKMFGVPVSNIYGIRLSIRNANGIVSNIFKGNCIEVRNGHIILEENPISAGKLVADGLIIKLSNPPEGVNGDILFDGEKVNHSKITDELFRAYPNIENIAEKDSVEIQFIYNNTFYRERLYINKDEIWVTPDGIPRTESKEFYLNTRNLDFPKNLDNISIILTGKGRRINIDNISMENSKRLHLFIPFPLMAGTYNLDITWPGLSTTYSVPLIITKSTIQGDIDLDKSLEEGIFDRYAGFDFTMTENITQKYIDSDKKIIDFSGRALENFYLLVPLENTKKLISTKTNLEILFENNRFFIDWQTIDKSPEKDLYIVAQNKKQMNLSSSRQYVFSKGIYFDTNFAEFKLSRPVPNNIFSYRDIKAVWESREGKIKTLDAYLENEEIKTTVNDTGTYAFSLEGMLFLDVLETHWAIKHINALSALGIINGMGDGTFLPEGMVTNAQFVKLVCEAVGIKTSSGGVSYFADVDKKAWYYDYVCAAESVGIIEGEYLNPTKPISRLEMAKMVTKAYEYYTNCNISQIAKKSTDKFTDIANLSIQDKDYVKAAYKLEIINGMTETIFAPEGKATRAQAATMIFRLLKTIEIA